MFDECEEVGELIYKYICSYHGSVGSGLNVTNYVSGVQDIVNLGGRSYPMDFYLKVFSVGDSLTHNGMLFSCLFVSTKRVYCEHYKYEGHMVHVMS